MNDARAPHINKNANANANANNTNTILKNTKWAFLGIASIASNTAGCPLAVTDDYEIVPNPSSAATSDPASPEAPSEPGEGECGEGFVCAPDVDKGSLVRIELVGVANCPPGWGSPSTFSDGTEPGCQCSCSSASNGTCKTGKIIEFETSSCDPGENQKDHSPADHGKCIDVYTGASGIKLEAPSATPGTCEASDPSPPPLALRSCELTAPPLKSCGAGRVCVPSIGPPPARLCNVVPPGATCAKGFAPDGMIYRVSEDTRECECSCGPASPATCTGASVELHGGKGCSASLGATLPVGPPCGDAAAFDALGSVKVNAGTWIGGQCMVVEKIAGDIKLDTLEAFMLCCASD